MSLIFAKKAMKNHRKTFVVTLFALLIGNVLFANHETIVQDLDPILINHQSGTASGGPRSSSTMIQAAYCACQSYIIINIENAGSNVDVLITNNTTNDEYEYEISGNGSSILPISGNTGYWTITFTLSTGDIYCGSFAL